MDFREGIFYPQMIFKRSNSEYFYILEESFTKEHIIELMKKHIEIIKSYEIAHTRVIPHQFAVLKSFISDLNHKLAVAEEKLKQLQDREGER